MLYNATTNTLNVYKSSTVSWLELSNSVTAAVPVATAATNVTKGGGMPGDGSFDSNWNASTGAASYYIYFDNNIGFLSYTSVNVLTLTHLWNGCDPGSTYYYRVTAVDACGVETGFSNIITVTIPP